MTKKKNRKKGRIIKVLLLILLSGFVLNWFLTYRLERFLQKELSERVAGATEGFYKLNFEKLDIGLFTGELEIDGITLKPDSTVFAQWKSADSLPDTYVDLAIEKIHFKGINLTWKISYKKLNFDLFEIKKPIVLVYGSGHSPMITEKNKEFDNKTLHDLIEPYINVLTVKRMNLENANVSYITNISEAQMIYPSVYGLKNVTFHAFGFRLDKDSYTSGKLLYCDDFDFITNEPQVLLFNGQLALNTDSIRLSTKDSLIEIRKIDLIPQKMLWTQNNRSPDNYVDAKIKAVSVKGIKFKRENAKNYLEARSFDIDRSEIKYFDTKRDSLQNVTSQPDSLDLTWSLYDVVSPLLSSISIDRIGVNDAGFSYSAKSQQGTDQYRLNNFNFNAYNFLINSLAHEQKKYLYSENFDVEAKGISGTIATKNHIFSIAKMSLSTVVGVFNIKNIQLWPISTLSKQDYMQGSIDSVSIKGLAYEKGVKAEELSIDAPSVNYVKIPGLSSVQRTDTISSPVVSSSLDLITPFFNYLSIDKVNINNGNIIFSDRRTKDPMTYRVPKLDFHASKVLINKKTITQSDSYFAYDDLSFSFEHFDNLLPGKEYRLKIRSGLYGGKRSNLRLTGVNLIPQENSWKKAPGTYLSLSIPALNIIGLDYKDEKKEYSLEANALDITSLQAKIVNTGSRGNISKKNDKKSIPFNIKLENFRVSNASVLYHDNVTNDSIDFSVKGFLLNKMSLLPGKELLLGNIMLQEPIFEKVSSAENKRDAANDVSSHTILPKLVTIAKIDIIGLKSKIEQPDFMFNTTLPSLTLRKIHKDIREFAIGDISILSPSISLNRIINEIDTISQEEKQSQDFYTLMRRFSEFFYIDKLNIKNAEIDYRNTLDGKTLDNRKFNSTNLDFTGLKIDNKEELFSMDDFNLNTKNLNFPIDNGFYTLQVGELNLSSRSGIFNVNELRLLPAYPQVEFTEKHPEHKDWFDISVGRIALSGIDFLTYFRDRILNIKDARIEKVNLLNFRNQKLSRPHRKVPMIYEGLQRLPVKLNVQNFGVRDFMVQYEELPKNGDEAAKIYFTGMNGTFTGFSNIVTRPQQYIQLDADGNLMSKGHFTARWLIPVDSLNDRFLLTAFLGKFDLRELNRLISPLAPAEVKSGLVDSLIFKTEASSKGATVQMRFLYNDLKVNLMKDKDGVSEPNRFISGIANSVIRTNNPNKEGKTPRESLVSLERDPYHSTFNYIWQILRPPLIESVGVPQKTQNFFKSVGRFVDKVKNIFGKGKKTETDMSAENKKNAEE